MVYKLDDKYADNNYRPISILPFIFKIQKKLMYNCLLNYLSFHNILVDNHFGVREAYSTGMALMRMVNDMSNELVNNIYSLDVFIDLPKAFDMVNHKILHTYIYIYIYIYMYVVATASLRGPSNEPGSMVLFEAPAFSRRISGFIVGTTKMKF